MRLKLFLLLLVVSPYVFSTALYGTDPRRASVVVRSDASVAQCRHYFAKVLAVRKEGDNAFSSALEDYLEVLGRETCHGEEWVLKQAAYEYFEKYRQPIDELLGYFEEIERICSTGRA